MTSAGVRHAFPIPLVAAGTTWLVMLSWKGFAADWGSFLGPLIAVALVVVGSGVALRLAPMPRRVAAPLHAVVVAVFVWFLLGGDPVHPLASTQDIATSVSDAWNSASTYAPPLPTNVPGIAPLMIPAGALSLLAVDYLACWLRRVPLAGLPLLAVYCVPISLLGGGVSWLLFLMAAAGFLLMLVLQETEHIVRWGRPLGATNVDPQGFGVNNGASRTTAGTVGAASVVLAVILPIFIPTLHLGSLGLFGPGGPGGGVKVVNPITDMRRDLLRGKDVPLLSIRTDDPDPSYLRIAVLTRFDGVEWSTGNRAIISDQLANGLVPLEVPDLGSNVVTHTHQYSVTATSDFESTWLPTFFPVSDVVANGDWHYDTSTMDFIAGDSHTTTAGLSWTMTGAKPDYSSYAMVHSFNAPLAIQQTYTALPSGLPPIVSTLASKVTAGADTRFQRAVMLQDWFRSSGHFRYSLQRSPGDGNDALAQFLTRGHGGRVGYCEQFASAFAVMARSLSIPTRVAIGFLQPTKDATGDWIYSAHDLHAWPEVYFPGSGWVRFEPTPGSRAGTVPAYTLGKVTKPNTPSAGQSAGGRVQSDTPSATKPKGLRGQTTTSSSSAGVHVPWVALLSLLVALAVLGGLAFVPGVVRRGRRRRRLAGGVEDAWLELRDSAVDLGVGWPRGRSPHETGRQLVGWFGPEPDGPPPVRPPRGPGLAPGAEDALDRIVHTLERVRYSRHAEDVPGALAGDVETCVAALEHGSARRVLQRSRWLPRSLFARADGASATAGADRERETVGAGGVVDHVG